MLKLLPSLLLGAFTGALLGCFSGVGLLQSAELGYGRPFFWVLSILGESLGAFVGLIIGLIPLDPPRLDPKNDQP